MKATQRYTSAYDRTYFVAELDGNYAFFVDDEPFLTIRFEKPPESIEQVLAIFVDVADQYSDLDNLKQLLQRDYEQKGKSSVIRSTIHPKRAYTRDPLKEVDRLVDRRDAATSTAAKNAYGDILTYFAEYDYDYEKTATRLKLEAGYLIARRKQDKGYVDELVRENWLVCIHIYRQWYRRFIGD